MKRLVLPLAAILVLSLNCPPKQNPPPVGITVQATGYGPSVTAARSDAKRAAVAQVIGEKVRSSTVVKNFMTERDVVTTQTEGCIKGCRDIAKKQTKDGWEVTVEAVVSLDPLERDIKTLISNLGDVVLLVYYDPANVKSADDSLLYEHAYDKIDEYLSKNGYKYVEKSVFLQRRAEVLKRNPRLSGDSLAREITRRAMANFWISFRLDHSTVVGTDAVSVLLKAYENETGYGLGVQPTQQMVAGGADDRVGGLKNAITSSLKGKPGQDSLMPQFDTWLTNWALNGIEYTVVLYNLQPGSEPGTISPEATDGWF